MSRHYFSWHRAKKKENDNTGSLEDISDNDTNQLDDGPYKSTIKTRPYDVQEDEKPFQIVLIDLKEAATNRRIRCVEKPLLDDDRDLKFVAISYRWGEVQETTVNTGVGYLATITSFDLDSFFGLCYMITKEIDLQYMQYVWVDAICVNQTNHVQRQTTIYHMTDIYQRANHILAVPDLHLAHLQSSSRNNQTIITGSMQHSHYIYYLIQGNMEKLLELDQQWLDSFGVPEDKDDHDDDNDSDQARGGELRHLLTHYTEHFTTGMTTCRIHDFWEYNQEEALENMNQMTSNATTIRRRRTPLIPDNDEDDGKGRDDKKDEDNGKNNDNSKVEDDGKDDGKDDDKNEDDDKHPVEFDALAAFHKLHSGDDMYLCPITKLFFKPNNNNDTEVDGSASRFVGAQYQEWKQLIPERSKEIRQSVTFLMDLLVDWSKRAWVVSEYHIAKNKSSKMKYWFIQFRDVFNNGYYHDDPPKSFFTFDFDEAFFLICDDEVDDDQANICPVTGTTTHKSKNLLQAFHSTMWQHLGQQTFLEKILKTNASRHEDRFHAILPSSEYKNILDNKTLVGYWHNNINTLASVKLELFTWMTTKHKLELLFLVGHSDNMCEVLPSFATTNIIWPEITEDYPIFRELNDPSFQGNFDLTSPSTIQLFVQVGNRSSPSSLSSCYKLNLKPKEYYHLVIKYLRKYFFLKKNPLPKLQALHLMDDVGDPHYDIIVIPIFSKVMKKEYYLYNSQNWTQRQYITLIGSMARNKWVLVDWHYFFGGDFSDMIVNNMGEEDWEHCYCDENNSTGFDIY